MTRRLWHRFSGLMELPCCILCLNFLTRCAARDWNSGDFTALLHLRRWHWNMDTWHLPVTTALPTALRSSFSSQQHAYFRERLTARAPSFQLDTYILSSEIKLEMLIWNFIVTFITKLWFWIAFCSPAPGRRGPLWTPSPKHCPDLRWCPASPPDTRRPSLPFRRWSPASRRCRRYTWSQWTTEGSTQSWSPGCFTS